MTDIRLWSRLIPYLENDYEIVHIPIPHSEDFDEIIDILFNQFEEEKVNILVFFRWIYCFIFCNYISK